MLKEKLGLTDPLETKATPRVSLATATAAARVIKKMLGKEKNN